MNETRFKIGDVVKVVPPKGKKFSVDETDFNGGITPGMVALVNTKNKFVVSWVYSDGTVGFKDIKFGWDVRWLQLFDETKEKKEKKIVTVDFVLSNDSVKAVDLHRVGVTKRNPKDDYDETIGMMVSLARMLKLPEDKVSGIIDVLYDDVPKKLSDTSYRELLEELARRYS